jgi:hypothetical protein
MYRSSLRNLAENCPLTALGEVEGVKESRPSGSVAASAGGLLTTMCRGSPTSLADSESGLLTVLGEAEESRPSDSVAASAGELLTTMRRGSLGSLADSENGTLTVLGEAGKAEESRPSGPATLLATLGSAAHSPTLLMTPGYPVGAGGCRWTCPVPCVPPSALIPTVSATQLSHSLLHSHRGVLQVSLVLLQEPRAQS